MGLQRVGHDWVTSLHSPWKKKLLVHVSVPPRLGDASWFLLLLGFNRFTVLSWFLSYNSVNQLYVYIYYLPLQSPSPPPSTPRSSQGTELSSPCYMAASLESSGLHVAVYECQCNTPNLSPSPHTPMSHVHSLQLHLYSCPANKFISTIFLDATYMASLVAQLVKNPPAVWETWVRSLSWEDPLEKGKATHSSILAWRIPWTVESVGLQRVGHNWATFTFTCMNKFQL